MKLINYIIYRIKWNLAPYFNFKSPVHIDLELNNNCNQSCSFCWHSDKKNLPFKIKKLSDITAIHNLIYCIDNNIKSIKFNWRGEPLLDVDRLSDYSRFIKKNKNIYTMINTNGKILKENISKLKYIDEIIISVDSFDDLNYKKLHNDDLYTIRILIFYLKFYKRKSLLHNKIKINIHENIVNELEMKENLKTYIKNLPFKVVYRKTEKREGENLSIECEQKGRKKVCPHMKRRLTVASNGKIFPCCVAYNEPDDLYLGDDIYKVWNSEKRLKLIENYKKGIYTESCKQCTSGDVFK